MLRLCTTSLLLLTSLTEQVLAATATQKNYYQELALQRTHELYLHTVPQWALGVNLVAATILFFVWRSQRNVPQFNWLLGACLAGNVTNLGVLFPNLLHPLAIDILLSTWLYCLTRILFTHPTASLQRWLSWIAALLLVFLSLARELGGESTHAILLSVALSLLATTAAVRLYMQLRTALSPKISLLIGVLLLGVSAVLDQLSVLLNWPLQQYLLLSPLAQLIAVILALYFLVARHANNQKQLSLLNATLDHRVKEAELELQDRYRLLTRDAVETAALRERRNIYQSIHEDLSDKLLQLIYRAPAPETADLARAALAELKDTQKLQPEQHRTLLHILADALAEVQTRCDQVNLNLSWNVAPQLESLTLNARQESALTRTLREAISNLFKHANASTVKISFWRSDTSLPELHYTVQDDGVGIDPTRPQGRGLINMRHRIEELGGQVKVCSLDSGGTLLTFTLPLAAEQS